MDVLILHGVIEDNEPTIPPEFSPEEVERYGRNISFFSWTDTTAETNHWNTQGLLKNGRVTIIGAGGTGSHAATALVAMGIGFLRLVDADTVDRSNLTRQVLYSERDIGRKKIEAAQERLVSLNQNVEIETVDQMISSTEEVKKVIEDVDIFILSANEPKDKIERFANQAAYEIKRTLIFASYASTAVNCMTFVPGISPCFECFYHELISSPIRRSYMDAETLFPFNHAVISPVAALPGQLAALEATYCLTGKGPRFATEAFQLNVVTMEQVRPQRRYWSGCPICGQFRKTTNLEQG